MSNEFKQEDHYIVFKLSDMSAYLSSSEADEVRYLNRVVNAGRTREGKESLNGVFIEEHWPEFEPTWEAIKARVTGTQPTSNIPDGWLRAIDEALVVAHIGVANESDTFEQAREKLDNLIGFHVDIATDPAVNGGWKLMPIEPTKEIYECFAAYDGTSYSKPFDFDDFSVDYGFALAAAPEAKS